MSMCLKEYTWFVTNFSSKAYFKSYISLLSFLFLEYLIFFHIPSQVWTQLDNYVGMDVIFAQQHATIIVKWSKTLQNRKTSTTIAIPVLGDSSLCPVKALKQMLHILPGDNNDPLFQVISAGRRIPLTDSAARKHLKN